MEATKLNSDEYNNKIIIVLLSIICVIIIGMLLKNASTIFIPFVLAVFLTFILNPIITSFEKIRIPSSLAILLSIILTLGVLVIIGNFIKGSIQSFVVEFPKYEGQINQIGKDVMNFFGISSPSTTSGQSGWQDNPQVAAILENLSIPALAKVIVESIGSFLSNAFFIFIILMFLLAGRNQFIKKSHIAFKSEVSERIVKIVGNINKQIQQYLVAKTLISLLTAFLVMIVLYLFDLEFLGIWVLMTFLLNFIPTVGSLVATLLPVPMAIIQFDSLGMVVWMVICIAFIQIVIGNIIEPKIVEKRINLSPIILMFSLTLWGYLWGVIGMFLAVPIMVMLRIVFENIEGLRFLSVYMGTAPDDQKK
ncbi:AI-2E family transporter [Bacteroidota bacterium]